MATSPIAKDREVVERIEKQSGQQIYDILRELDDQDLSLQVYQENSMIQPKGTDKQLIVSFGLLCAGISCMGSLYFKPEMAIAVTPIAFVTGAAAQSVSLVNEKRSK
ncbi:MAG: hypothetical protein V7L24_30460 [Nostoc sp.]